MPGVFLPYISQSTATICLILSWTVVSRSKMRYTCGDVGGRDVKEMAGAISAVLVQGGGAHPD